MQINSGLVSINPIENPAVVTGNESVDWTQVMVGNLFICNGKTFQITSVDQGTTTPLVLPSLTISPVWPSAAITNNPYAIVRDYSLNFNLPLLNQGDLEAAAIWTRTVQIIDSMLGTTGSTTNEITVGGLSIPTQFIVGNMVGFDATGWFLCEASGTKMTIVGCVTEVAVDKLSFKIKTEGRIVGMANITMTPGTVYYLVSSATLGQANLAKETDAATGITKIPALNADTATSGYLLNLASGSTGVYSGPGTIGSVPNPNNQAPPITDVNAVLTLDGKWKTLTVGVNAIRNEHLDPAGAPILSWPAWIAGTAGQSVYKHITDLQNRLATMEAVSPDQTNLPYTRRIFTWLTNTSSNEFFCPWSVSIPAGVSWVIATVISPSNYSVWDANGLYTLSGADINQTTLPKSPGVVTNATLFDAEVLRVRLSVTGVSTLMGDLGSLNDNAANHGGDFYPTTLWINDKALPANQKITVYGPYMGHKPPIIHGSIASSQTGVFMIRRSITATDLLRLVNDTSFSLSVRNSKAGRKYEVLPTGMLSIPYAVKGAVIIEYGVGAVLGGL